MKVPFKFKISVIQLDNAGLDLEGEIPYAFLELDGIGLFKCRENIHYKLHASLVNSGILVTGRAGTHIKAKCGRCLKSFEQVLENTEVCHFYEHVDVSEIDITEDLREDVLINMPQNLLCKEDCNGLCPLCGSDLNKKKCNCVREITQENIWGELDKLDLDKD